MPEFTVYVDSDNRNQTLYPNSNSFTLHLTNPIMNISKAELVSAMLPSINVSEFVTLDILELRSPRHQTADSLTVTKGSTSSNSFNGAFAIVPIKASGTFDFYNQNYRIRTEYPQRIDKLDRLTVTWRQPNNGAVYYDGSDLGRNMFLLRFETVHVPMEPERPVSLPDPVEWDSGEKQRLWIVFAASIGGLILIMSMQRKRYIASLQVVE